MMFDLGPNITSVLITLISALAALTAAYFAKKAATTATTTHDAVNGQSAALVALTAKSSMAEGVLQGTQTAVAAQDAAIVAASRVNPPAAPGG